MLRLTEGEGFVHAVFGLNELTGTLRESNRSWSIIVDNDRNAAAMIDALTAEGFVRGRHYRTVSFDDDEKFGCYNLTTIAPPLQEIGEELGRMISETIDIDAQGDRNFNTQLHSVMIIERELGVNQ